MDNKISINENVKELVIREGQAPKIPDIKDPLKVKINGTIDAVKRFLEKRDIKSKECNIIVNKDKMSIALVVDEKDFYGTEISGSLKLNPDFTQFGINANVERTPHQLGEFIKMNRYFFEKKSTAMNLVKLLKNFEATVGKELENKNDDQDEQVFLCIKRGCYGACIRSYELQSKD